MSEVYIELLSRDLKNQKVGHHPPSTVHIFTWKLLKFNFPINRLLIPVVRTCEKKI